MKIVKVSLLIVAFTIFVVSCATTGDVANNTANSAANEGNSENVSQANASPEIVISPKGMYADSCAECHKADGSGGKVDIDGKTLKPKSLISAGAKKDSDEEFIKYISDGFPEDGMPAFKDKLSADEIKLIVKYIREELQKS